MYVSLVEWEGGATATTTGRPSPQPRASASHIICDARIHRHLHPTPPPRSPGAPPMGSGVSPGHTTLISLLSLSRATATTTGRPSPQPRASASHILCDARIHRYPHPTPTPSPPAPPHGQGGGGPGSRTLYPHKERGRPNNGVPCWSFRYNAVYHHARECFPTIRPAQHGSPTRLPGGSKYQCLRVEPQSQVLSLIDYFPCGKRFQIERLYGWCPLPLSPYPAARACSRSSGSCARASG